VAGTTGIRVSAEDPHLLALCSLPQLGPVTIRRLLRAFSSAEQVFGAPEGALKEVEGISDGRAGAITGFGDITGFERGISKARAEGISIIAAGTEGYPRPLEALGEDSPLILYIRGGWRDEDRHALAIVGSRNATGYGLRMTARVAEELGARGITIVSGMAMGIDAEAHSSAMASGGRTLAVLGSGVDVAYPASNRALMKKVEKQGALISEFAPGARGHKLNFPVRNRLISALSLGVLVVEAAKKSGSLITAGHAMDQGRPVFAVPGNADSANSEGTNELIRKGARVLTEPGQVLDELAPMLEGFISRDAVRLLPDLSPDEEALVAGMSREPVHIDELSRSSGLPVSRALALLMGLELKGAIRQTEGKRFHLL
jgi:DNA processing protein